MTERGRPDLKRGSGLLTYRDHSSLAVLSAVAKEPSHYLTVHPSGIAEEWCDEILQAFPSQTYVKVYRAFTTE